VEENIRNKDGGSMGVVTQQYYSRDRIRQMDGEEFILGTLALRKVIINLLTCIPAEVVDYLMQHCLVISTWQNCDGQYFPSKLIKRKDIILLSEYLLDGDEDQRDKTILHEFAHCWLRHQSPVLKDGMTGEEILKQEDEADELAYRWGKNRGKHLLMESSIR
jgi:hypothetical protein